jgi:hypothetical protein
MPAFGAKPQAQARSETEHRHLALRSRGWQTPGRALVRWESCLGEKDEGNGLGWYEATRHTFASQWVLAGNSIEKVSVILGHWSVTQTEVYAHLRPDLFSTNDLATISVDLRPSAASIGTIGPEMAPSGQEQRESQREKVRAVL